MGVGLFIFELFHDRLKCIVLFNFISFGRVSGRFERWAGGLVLFLSLLDGYDEDSDRFRVCVSIVV